MLKNMFKNKWQKILLSVSLWLSLFPPVAFAAGILPTPTGSLGKGVTCKSSNCGNYSLNDMLSLMVNISNWILGCVGAVALLFFIYGGFVFILSGGSEEKVKEGKQILLNAIIGLAVVFASYLIIRFSAGLLGAGVTNGLQVNISPSTIK
jgi:hypothetical protein